MGTATSSQTAAERLNNGSPNSNLAATAQADQYWRDAQATTAAQQATQQANYQNVRGTAQAAQATQVAQSTRDALHLALTVDAATVQAHQTAEAATRTFETTATAQAQANAVATATEAAVIAQTTRQAQQEAAAVAATATRVAFDDQQRQQQARRDLYVDGLRITFATFGVFLFGVVLLFLAWQLVPVIATRVGMVRYGQHGNPIFTSQRHGRVIITDPLRMQQAALTVDEYGNVNMPHLTDDAIQTTLARDVLHTLIEQARHAPGHAPIMPSEVNRLLRLGVWTKQDITRYDEGSTHQHLLTVDHNAAGANADADTADLEELPLPNHVPWSLLAGYGGSGIALGAGRGQQIVSLNLARLPHLFVAGMSGSGKTRRLLRPLIAQALAAGYYAVLMNESGSDFSPFYDHPNVAVVRGDVYAYMGVMEAAMAEMSNREQLLRDLRVSEWGRLPNDVIRSQPFMLLAIDELLALAATLTPKEQKQFWAMLTAFASRARKVGMSSMGLATDPTYRALGQGGLNYRSQCGRISFRMFQAAGSRAILDQNGAEQLEESQFLALLDAPGVQEGVAANPSDADLASYLTQRGHVAPCPAPYWLPALPDGQAGGGGAGNPTQDQSPVVAAPYISGQLTAAGAVGQPPTYQPPAAPSRLATDLALSLDALALTEFADQPDDYKTLNAILAAVDEDEETFPGWNRNGEGFARLKEALRYRATEEGCAWAKSVRGYPWSDSG